MKHFYPFLFAIFISSLGFGQTTIHCWDFNGTAPGGNFNASPLNIDNRVTGDGAITHNISDAEDFSGNSSNACMGSTSGAAFCPRPGTGLANNGNHFTLEFSTVGFENIVLSFYSQSTGSGFNSNQVSYSTNGGSSFTDFGSPFNPSSSVSTFDFSAISAVNNNANFQIRITLNGGTGATGNNRFDNVKLEGTALGGTDTEVQFASASASVSEAAGTYDLTLSISNEDGANATTCNVALITGDPADVDSYSTQMVTFPAGSSTDETVTVTVTDDSLFEGNETLTFEIQAVSGGNNAMVGSTSTFDLTINDNDIDPSIPSLIITEVADPGDDFNGRFVEVYNNGSEAIDLDAEQIHFVRQANGGTINSIALTGTLSPNCILVIGNSSNITTVYGFAADVNFGSVTGNGDDGYFLYYDGDESTGTLLDAYGVLNVDGTGEPWEYTDSRAIRNNPKTTNPNATWTALEWSISSANVADMNPGALENEFRYGDAWKPSNPNGVSTISDDIIIVSGNTNITANTSANTVVIKQGSSLTVDSGATLTIDDVAGMTLNSTSSSYSSLILDGTISGNVSYNRAVNSFTNDATNNDNDLISAPLTGQTFGSFEGANANLLASGSTRAFAPFNNDTGAYENYDATTNAATTLDAADGYRAATSDGGTLTFTGTVNTGTIFKDITVGTDLTFGIWNLLGNPYPSFIDIDAFLTHVVSTQTSGERNIDLLEGLSGIYGYDGDTSDGWDVITLANSSGRFMAPGQGFFVAANGAGTLIADHDIEFTAAMRAASSSDDFIVGRNNDALTFLELNASTTTDSYNTEFYFNTEASLGLDQGYDAVIWGANPPSFAMYSHLVQDNTGEPIALQALGAADYNNVTIPLGVHANPGEQLTFSISENTLPSNVNIYLEDNVANTFTLLNTNDYILTPSTALTGTGRFYINFSVTTLSASDYGLNSLAIYTNEDTIVISGELEQSTTANIFDLQGRLVSSKGLDIAKRQQHIDASSLSSGVYIVQLANDLQSISQKVIIR